METVTLFQCSLLEYDGEGDFGQYSFSAVPRAGETVETPKGIFKVAEVRHVAYDEEGGADLILFVRPL